MDRRDQPFIIIIILIFFLSLSSFPASAATKQPRVYFETTASQIAPGSKFSVQVLVDAPQPINAVDIEINYAPEILELSSLNNSQSIIDFWRGESQNLSAGNTIKLQGGSINPFTGNGGKIITLNFRARKEGRANLSFAKSNLYYADGKGTRADSEPAASLNISITEGVKSESSAWEAGIIEDRISPTIETAKVVSNPIDRSRLAVFHAIDNDSGIKNTEIRFRRWFSWSDWQAATNPVRLPNTAWAFQVKATDNAGNDMEETVYVPQAILHLATSTFIFIVVITAIYISQRRRKIA